MKNLGGNFNATAKGFGVACSNPGAIKGSLLSIISSNNYAEAIRKNI